MNNVANEMRKDSSHMVDVGVTLDGTWQHRAISIDSENVLDVEDDPQKLEEWHKAHKESCCVNYSGTVSAMEVGAKTIFARSIERFSEKGKKGYSSGKKK